MAHTPSHGAQPAAAPSSSPSPLASSSSSAQQAIDASARSIVRAWPVGAGLVGAGDVVSHLPPILPAPPSFFPSLSTPPTSLNPAAAGLVPSDPLFDQYSREISALLHAGQLDPQSEAWRNALVAQATALPEVRDQLARVQTSGPYAGLPPLAPPYPVAPSALPSAPPSSTHPLSSAFLRSSAFSHPSLAPGAVPPPSNPLQPRHLAPLQPGEPSDEAALKAFVDAQYERKRAALEREAQAQSMRRSNSNGGPQTPSLSQGRVLPSGAAGADVPMSSPDPLMMMGGDSPVPLSRTHSASALGPRSSLPHILAQPAGMGASAVPRKRTSSSSLSSHFSSPLKPDNLGPQPGLGPRPSQGQITPTLAASNGASQQGQQLGEPFTGAESAVKRVKLLSGGGGGGTGSARTAPGTGGSATVDVVERLSDLVTDIFAADDAFVGDTSGAALSTSATAAVHRSPSRKGGEAAFFRATRTAPHSGAPLLHTSALRKLAQQLRAVGLRSKGEELVDELGADAGIGRLLRLLERSWEGVGGEGGWEGWEDRRGEIGRARDADELVGGGAGKKGAVKGKGKGKAASKGRKGSASPAKGKGKKRATNGEDEEDDDEDDDVSVRGSSASPSKGVRRSSRSASPRRDRSQTLDADGLDALDAADESQRSTAAAAADVPYWDEGDPPRLAVTEARLRDLSDALLALRLALDLLTLPGVSLPKHLFSSEYLLALVSALRRALDACLVPLVEAHPTSPLAELATLRARDKVADTCDALVQATNALAALVRKEDLGDELVIAISYFALEPFFHDAAATSGKGASAAAAAKDASPAVHAVKALRIASLAVVQAVYARYADQRAWIVEEVLSNLGKAEVASGTAAAKKARGGIRLRTGASIQTVSALLLHLVQTCPSDLHAQIRRRFARASVAANGAASDADGDIAMKDELGLGARLLDGGSSQENESDDDVYTSVHGVLSDASETSSKAARMIVGFLLQRAAKAGKTTGASADTEYRAVLDNLIADLLATLRLPEWPGSELLLSVLCRSMMATLADSKSTHEVNALKGLALEHVGAIAARVRHDLGEAGTGIKSVRELASSGDLDGIEKTFVAQKSLVEHLARTEKSSGFGEFALEVHQALQSTKSQFESSQEEAHALQARLEDIARTIWDDEQVEDVFGPSPEDAQPRIDGVALDLWRSSTLANLYQPLLTRIVDASESAQVTLRTKALRAISAVVAQDPSLFHQENVRRSIEGRMLDSSPAVRDASIELVGKYVVGRPDLAVQYLPKLGERISDTGLGVRRRVIKLLKILYGLVDDEKHRLEISRRLVYRVLDEDDGIKELAIETLEDLWFGSPVKNAAAQDSNDAVAQLASIITQTAGVYKERAPPVDEALRLIMAKHMEKGTEPPLERLRLVIESLIDGLVEDERDMDLVAGIKTVYTLSSVDPSLLSTSKATMLLPFLKSSTTVEEQVISDYLLRIFRAAVSAMPKTATRFGRDLQSALVPMLNKPSQNVVTLQEVVACFCAVVHGQTQDYATLVRVFGVTLKRLQSECQKLSRAETANTVNLRALPVLAYLSSLLCEHGDFDQLRDEHLDIKPSVDAITVNSVAELTFQLLVRAYGLPLPAPIKSPMLTSLGFLYRAYPTLMLHASSTAIIDAIFELPDTQAHIQILRIIQDFLASQERTSASAAPVAQSAPDKRRKKAENGVKMEELVGNVEGFADSGVASAVSQRYLKRIISSAQSTNPVMQRLGADLLNMIARSGFSHPITLSPTLVALTTSPDPQLSTKAYSTLALLHQKHASILATRFLEPARAAHAFVKSMCGQDEVLQGYRNDPPESLLGRWYSLLHKEKRQVQLDYLKTLARSFELEVGATCSENDVSFARFLAEALSTLDFKRTEEPLLIIHHLNTALAVSGLQVLHALEQDLQGGGGLMAAAKASPSKLQSVADDDGMDRPPSADLARQSLVSGLALLLRDHLKHVYSITDAKLAKYVPGKKSAMGDKALTRRTDAPLALGLAPPTSADPNALSVFDSAYDRMPLVVSAHRLDDEQERCEQRATYMRLIAEDGTIGALDELDAGEDGTAGALVEDG
ncbi:hypothetical protein Rhopal_007364-T1 [Rhodotorula paludigena]|uniref:Sister chromatid cohesion protein n=1 Tax=Rhodotorula paludigena TaxID=86838 RepID=A0AAV5GXU3_9BASI|nr:hypothetical protein Rhopal_007364-T1 [Rhodotorula paludigena]